jgi:uncharacterized membrane protein
LPGTENDGGEKKPVEVGEELTGTSDVQGTTSMDKLSTTARKASAVIYSGLRKAVITPQILFLIIASILGLTLVFLNPMFHVADEPAHFWKAYSVGELHLLSVREKGIEGNEMHLSIQKTMETVKFQVADGLKIDEKAVDQGFRIPLNSGKKGFMANGVAGLYPPVPYIPQAVGIDIGRIFNESPLTLAYMGRAFNLLAWLILVFLAISITPVFKWVFFLLGVMPMAMLQAASLSPDSVTNGLAFLTVAFFLRLAFAKDKRRVTKRDIVLMFVLGVLLAFVKQPYFLLVFLFLLIPRSKFKSKKEYYVVFAALVLIVLVIGMSWTMMESSAYTPPHPDVVSGKQVSFILHHPYTAAVILLRTINVYKEGWLSGFVGAFDWFETALPMWIAYLFLFALIGTAVLDKDKDIEIRNSKKLLMLVIAVAMFLGVVAALYLSWTPVGYFLIQGVQGRYLIPLAPLILLLFYNRAVSYDKGKAFYALMVAIPVLTTYFTISRIWHRFY